MAFSTHNIVSVKNNQALRKKISYFKNQKATINRSRRTTSESNTFNPVKDAYSLTRERRRKMFRKGILLSLIFLFSIFVIALGAVWLMG